MPPTSARNFKDAAYGYLAEVGKALSSRVRLEILDLLSQAPRTVENLAAEVGQSVANTSHHLQALKRARLVESTREGAHIRYRLAAEDVAALVAQLHRVARRHLTEIEELTREHFEELDGLDAVDREELIDRLKSGDAVLVDVRPAREFEEGHVEGAISAPLEELEERLAELPRDRMIVAYCRGPFCTFSAKAAKRLRELGYDARRTDVSVHDPELREVE